MSEYSFLNNDENVEYLCPICGSILEKENYTGDGWNCKCGEFILKGMEINSYKGISNQHKQNKIWR
jgi:DNA-directed RNA polymerase subunit RPC12/RpoP